MQVSNDRRLAAIVFVMRSMGSRSSSPFKSSPAALQLWRHGPTIGAMTDRDIPEEKSKSQLKRDSEELKDLGEDLVRMNAAQRDQIPMDDSIRTAIEHALQITAHGARRRQIQYLGKLLRETDVEPIRAAVEALRQSGHQSTAYFQRLERWRDRLIAEGDGAINDFLAQHPNTDRHQLRQLVRAAHKEKAENTPPRSARALFRFLREQSEHPPAESV